MDLDLSRRAWFPASRQFCDSVGHTSSFPLAYAYASFLTVSGHLIGRTACIRYASLLYPNSYTCLVGASGISHKTTAMNLTLESLGEGSYGIYPLRHIGTSQGLLQDLEVNGGKTFILLDEMASLLTMKRQDFAADLLARIVELYGCPDRASTGTRVSPINVKDTFTSLLAGSTIEWLRSSLTSSDLLAGFGNRMTFVLGTPRAEHPWPKKPYFDDLQWDRLLKPQGLMRLDDRAAARWERYYPLQLQRSLSLSSMTRTMAERINEKVLKCAVVQACWEGTNIIDGETMTRAIDWGDYLFDCVVQLTPSFEAVDKQVLHAIVGGQNTRQKLFGALSHELQARRIKEAIDSLKWLKMLEEEEGVLIPVERME